MRARTLAFVSSLVVFAQAVPMRAHADDGPAEAREEARTRFARGVELYNEQEYALALIEFERAYAIAPSYTVLYNVAQVSAQLRKYAKAVTTFERYLAEGGSQIPEARVEEVRRELAAARARTAKLLVRVNQPDAEIVLDAQPIARSPMQAAELVESGEHMLAVSKASFRTFTRVVVLAGGDTAAVDVQLEPLSVATIEPPGGEPKPTTNRTPAWIAWGSVGVLAAGTAVFGVLALNESSELDRLKHTRGSTEGERDDAGTKSQTFAIVADVLGAAALVTAGVALYLTLRKEPRTSAQLGASPSSLILRGTF